MHTKKNVYFEDPNLVREIEAYQKKHHLNFSQFARNAFRLYLRVKKKEEELLKNAKIELGNL